MAQLPGQMTLEEAVNLVNEYETLGPAAYASKLSGVNEYGQPNQVTAGGQEFNTATRIISEYAMKGGDISGFPASVLKYTTPEYANFVASRGSGQWSDVLPLVLTAAGGLAGVAAGGATAAGAGAGAAEGGAAAAGGEAALGSGVSAGATGASGLSTTASGASGLSAAGATGSLAPGFFSAETAGGLGSALASGGGSGGPGSSQTPGGGSTTPQQQTALQKILDGTATTQDYVTAFGQIAPSLLGMYAADKQADAYKGLAAQYAGYGAPYRERLGTLYEDPTAFLKSPEVQVPVQMGTDALARALSVQGNPARSGAALQQLQSYASDQLFGRLGQEKDRLAGFGGLASYNAAAPQVASGAIDANRGVYDALGYGIGQVTNPPRSLADILKAYNISQGLT